jgi:hypothetical protein
LDARVLLARFVAGQGNEAGRPHFYAVQVAKGFTRRKFWTVLIPVRDDAGRIGILDVTPMVAAACSVKLHDRLGGAAFDGKAEMTVALRHALTLAGVENRAQVILL